MISKKLKNFLSLSLVGAMMVGFTACSSDSSDNNGGEAGGTSLQSIQKKGNLVVGLNPDYPPFEFKDKDQSIVGADVEMAKEIAKDMGVKLEMNEAQFASLIPMLKAGKIDMIISGMNETEERKQEVAFSDVYYTGESVIVINKKDSDKYKTKENLKGAIVGVQLGSVPETLAEEELTESEILPLGIVSDLVLQLKGDKINAVVLDDIVGKAYVKNNEDLMLIEEVVLKSKDAGFAIAVPKGEDKLLAEVNKTLARLKEENKLEEFLENAIKKSEALNK